MPKVKPKWIALSFRCGGPALVMGIHLRVPKTPQFSLGQDTGLLPGPLDVFLDKDLGLLALKCGGAGPLKVRQAGNAAHYFLTARAILDQLGKSFALGPLPWRKEDGMVIVDCSGLPDVEE